MLVTQLPSDTAAAQIATLCPAADRTQRAFYSRVNRDGYSTVTDFARLRGWSTSLPLASAIA